MKNFSINGITRAFANVLLAVRSFSPAIQTSLSNKRMFTKPKSEFVIGKFECSEGGKSVKFVESERGFLFKRHQSIPQKIWSNIYGFADLMWELRYIPKMLFSGMIISVVLAFFLTGFLIAFEFIVRMLF